MVDRVPVAVRVREYASTRVLCQRQSGSGDRRSPEAEGWQRRLVFDASSPPRPRQCVARHRQPETRRRGRWLIQPFWGVGGGWGWGGGVGWARDGERRSDGCTVDRLGESGQRRRGERRSDDRASRVGDSRKGRAVGGRRDGRRIGWLPARWRAASATRN